MQESFNDMIGNSFNAQGAALQLRCILKIASYKQVAPPEPVISDEQKISFQ